MLVSLALRCFRTASISLLWSSMSVILDGRLFQSLVMQGTCAKLTRVSTDLMELMLDVGFCMGRSAGRSLSRHEVRMEWQSQVAPYCFNLCNVTRLDGFSSMIVGPSRDLS